VRMVLPEGSGFPALDVPAGAVRKRSYWEAQEHENTSSALRGWGAEFSVLN
jgi:hypothetical protein